MKTMTFLAVAMLALLAAGCAEKPYSQRAIAEQSRSGHLGHQETGFQAVDIFTSPDGQPTQIWQGPVEIKKETAMADAAERHKQYPDHNVQVIHPADH
jgi:hypothetical protein